ncbi:MAG: DUF2303 family protein [Ectothiorhodospiraceae bacterium]|nr:DUF2303 family protein [Ectothiorhodospiraceae bacterium]
MTTLWADRDHGRAIAVLNDHEASPDGEAGWGDHRATLTLRDDALLAGVVRGVRQAHPPRQRSLSSSRTTPATSWTPTTPDCWKSPRRSRQPRTWRTSRQFASTTAR